MADILPTKDYEKVIIVNIPDDGIVGIITNPRWWMEYIDQGLETWCLENRIQFTGMILHFPDMETATMFRLTWGN